jgi:hypothetical protein
MGSVVLVLAGCGGVHWQEHTSNDGGFKVLMPGAPKKESHTVETSNGPITFNAAVVELPPGAFVASWADLPPKVPIDLDKSIRQIAERYRGKVEGTPEALEKDGFPGKAFVLQTQEPAGHAVGRIYQVRNRLYVLLAVGTNVKEKGSAETNRFFDTFKLINPLMKPETTASP